MAEMTVVEVRIPATMDPRHFVAIWDGDLLRIELSEGDPKEFPAALLRFRFDVVPRPTLADGAPALSE